MALFPFRSASIGRPRRRARAGRGLVRVAQRHHEAQGKPGGAEQGCRRYRQPRRRRRGHQRLQNRSLVGPGAGHGYRQQRPQCRRAAHHRHPRPAAGTDPVAGEYQAATDAAAKATVATTLARRYNNVERFDSAGYYLEQVALAKPSCQAWQQAADAYFQAFSFAATDERVKLLGGKARELYAKVLEKQPGNLDAKTNLGMAYMASENPVQGISLLREVLEADPRNEKALYNMGILAVQSNQYDKAVTAFPGIGESQSEERERPVLPRRNLGPYRCQGRGQSGLPRR